MLQPLNYLIPDIVITALQNRNFELLEQMFREYSKTDNPKDIPIKINMDGYIYPFIDNLESLESFVKNILNQNTIGSKIFTSELFKYCVRKGFSRETLDLVINNSVDNGDPSICCHRSPSPSVVGVNLEFIWFDFFREFDLTAIENLIVAGFDLHIYYRGHRKFQDPNRNHNFDFTEHGYFCKVRKDFYIGNKYYIPSSSEKSIEQMKELFKLLMKHNVRNNPPIYLGYAIWAYIVSDVFDDEIVRYFTFSGDYFSFFETRNTEKNLEIFDIILGQVIKSVVTLSREQYEKGLIRHFDYRDNCSQQTYDQRMYDYTVGLLKMKTLVEKIYFEHNFTYRTGEWSWVTDSCVWYWNERIKANGLDYFSGGQMFTLRYTLQKLSTFNKYATKMIPPPITSFDPSIFPKLTLEIKNTIHTFTAIRSVCLEQVISLMPNELMFQIFKHLLF